jgi:hypothetical protein
VGPGAAAEEADAAQELAIGDAGGAEDDVVARGQVVREVHALEVVDVHAHAARAFALLLRAPPELGLDLAAKAFQGGRRQHALRRAAGAHHGVHARPRYRDADGGRQVAVADELDTGPRRPHFGDELLVPLPLQDHDGDVPHVAAQP